MKKFILSISIGLIMVVGCSNHPTYTAVDKDSQTPNIAVIKNKNGVLSLQIEGDVFYGNLAMVYDQRYTLNPLIHSISGNAKGTLKSKSGQVLTCVMDLDPITLSGNGYCLQEGESKLKKISLLTMQ